MLKSENCQKKIEANFAKVNAGTMEKESICKMIQIPIMNAPGEYIKFFPDELPADPYDVIDVLRSELAPLKIWRACAVSFFVELPNIN